MSVRRAILIASAILVASPLAAQLWEVDEQAIGYPFGAQVGAAWGATAVAADFDGDGYDDLLVGAPLQDRTLEPAAADAGAAFLFLGGPAGFGTYAEWFDGSTANGKLGFALAVGNFDNDGDYEFVYGEPGSDVGADEAGVANVRYWSGSGWPTATALREGSGTPGTQEAFDHFGAAFAVGDFNDDPYDDLVVGIPDENLEGSPTYLDAGAIMVFYGTASGLNYTGSQIFDQSMAGLGGAQANAHFGFSLAAGDFDGDGYDDLAVGVPYREVSAVSGAGQVVVLFGGSGGLSTTGAMVFDDTDLGGSLGTDDHFGYALASADFDLSLLCVVLTCYDDLAIGIPGEPVGASHAGGVVIAYGSASGPALDPLAQFLSQNNVSAADENPEVDDHFGSVLVAGSFDARFGADLAIGVPEEDVGATVDQGVVHLVFGGATGLNSYPDQLIVQRAGFTVSPGATGNLFGSAIAFGDFRNDGWTDGAIGVPGFHRSGIADSGHVQVLNGAVFADGFESNGKGIWSTSTP